MAYRDNGKENGNYYLGLPFHTVPADYSPPAAFAILSVAIQD